MIIGHITKVQNTRRKFGADLWYWRVKVRDALTGQPEPWLATGEEAERFASRVETAPSHVLGVVAVVPNEDIKLNAAEAYYEVVLRGVDGEPVYWALTDTDRTRLRARVRRNHEDAHNVFGWLRLRFK